MKKEHEEMLLKLQVVMDEMLLMCEQDFEFNCLLWELNNEQNVFKRSLDEYSIAKFIESKRPCSCGNETFVQVDAYIYKCTECKKAKDIEKKL